MQLSAKSTNTTKAARIGTAGRSVNYGGAGESSAALQQGAIQYEDEAEYPRYVADMLTIAPTRFSAVDCPVCGCQIALAFRAPRIDLPAISEQHDADTEKSEVADE